MSKKLKHFSTKVRIEFQTSKENVRAIDERLAIQFQQELKNIKSNIQQLEKRKEELQDPWREYWRVDRRLREEKKKLKRYSY